MRGWLASLGLIAACSSPSAPPAPTLGAPDLAAEPGVDATDPAYVDASRFSETELRIGEAPFELGATLSLPNGRGPWPAVVLVHGSGPHDRDETLGPNKPFRDLAQGLASRGIAVLRYDKRTLTHPMERDWTLNEETIIDALAAAEAVRGADAIDVERVYLLGHSLGGLAIPRIAKRDRSLAGFIVLGGSIRPLEDSLLAQLRYVAELDGKISSSERGIVADMQARARRVRALRDAQPSQGPLPLDLPRAYWRDLVAHPPADEIAGERRPFLVLHGDRDYQVTVDDFRAWKRALADGSATFHRYPNLNHLFMKGEGKSAPPEYRRPGHVAREVIEDVAAWVASR